MTPVLDARGLGRSRVVLSSAVGASIGLTLGAVCAAVAAGTNWAAFLAMAAPAGALAGGIAGPRIDRGDDLIDVAAQAGIVAVVAGALLSSGGSGAIGLVGLVVFGPILLPFTVPIGLLAAFLTRGVLRRLP